MHALFLYILKIISEVRGRRESHATDRKFFVVNFLGRPSFVFLLLLSYRKFCHTQSNQSVESLLIGMPIGSAINLFS